MADLNDSVPFHPVLTFHPHEFIYLFNGLLKGVRLFARPLQQHGCVPGTAHALRVSLQPLGVKVKASPGVVTGKT